MRVLVVSPGSVVLSFVFSGAIFFEVYPMLFDWVVADCLSTDQYGQRPASIWRWSSGNSGRKLVRAYVRVVGSTRYVKY